MAWIKKTASKIQNGFPIQDADLPAMLYKYMNEDLTALSSQERINLHNCLSRLEPKLKTSRAFTEEEIKEIKTFGKAVSEDFS